MAQTLLIANKDRWGKRVHEWLKSISKNINITLTTVEKISMMAPEIINSYTVIFYSAPISKIDTALCTRLLFSVGIKVAFIQDVEISCLERRVDLFDHIYTPSMLIARYQQQRLGSIYSHQQPDFEFLKSDEVLEPTEPTSIGIFEDLSEIKFNLEESLVKDYLVKGLYILKSYDSIVRAITYHRPFIAYNVDGLTKSFLEEIKYPVQLIVDSTPDAIGPAINFLKENIVPLTNYMLVYHKISKARLENCSLVKFITGRQRPKEIFIPSPDEILNLIKRNGPYQDTEELARYLTILVKQESELERVKGIITEAEKIPNLVFELCQKTDPISLDLNIINRDSSICKILSSYQKKNGILFDADIEKSFTKRRATYGRIGLIPYDVPWIGVLHSFNASVFEETDIIISLTTCLSIIVLSENDAIQVREQLKRFTHHLIKVVALPYANADTLLANSNFNLDRSRHEMRLLELTTEANSTDFYNISSVGNYKKVSISFDSQAHPSKNLKDRLLASPHELQKSGTRFDREVIKAIPKLNFDANGEEKKESDLIFDSQALNATIAKIENVEYITNPSKDLYKDYICSSIGFLNIRNGKISDSGLIDFINCGTPVVAFKHPSVVEYLGDDYPLYFTELSEIPDLLVADKIQTAFWKLKKRHDLYTSKSFLEKFNSLFAI